MDRVTPGDPASTGGMLSGAVAPGAPPNFQGEDKRQSLFACGSGWGEVTT